MQNYDPFIISKLKKKKKTKKKKKKKKKKVNFFTLNRFRILSLFL
jgi:alpha-D-ribose 1-methylphosphonate 5-triphosphate synthase subunit PhnG